SWPKAPGALAGRAVRLLKAVEIVASRASPMMPSAWYLRLSFFLDTAGRVASRRGLAGTSSAPWGDAGAAACSLRAGTTGADVVAVAADDPVGAAVGAAAVLDDGAAAGVDAVLG